MTDSSEKIMVEDVTIVVSDRPRRDGCAVVKQQASHVEIPIPQMCGTPYGHLHFLYRKYLVETDN